MKNTFKEFKDLSVSLLVSQIGYEPNRNKLALLRCDDYFDNEQVLQKFSIIDPEIKKILYKNNITFWGKKWNINFWTMDFSEFKKEGKFYIETSPFNLKSQVFQIKNSLFREETLIKTSVEQLEAKVANKPGWLDCAGDMRGLEPNTVALIGLCDAYEAFESTLDRHLRERFIIQIKHGAEYVALCQRHDGSFMNEYYIAREKTRWYICMLAVLALIRSFEITGDLKHFDRAKKGWDWCLENKKYTKEEIMTEIEDTRSIYGKYSPWVPPKELRARDKLLIVLGGTELYKNTNDLAYKNIAIEYADDICDKLQFLDYSKFEHGIYGNFYAWENTNVHQKSWEHAGWGYNCGSVFPDEVSGLINLIKLFPYEKKCLKWKHALREYAYGYLKPTSKLSPFGIYPLGMWGREIRFFGPTWHGANAIYGRIAKTSMIIARIFEDPDFEKIAIQNMQWIVGLNTGLEKSPGIYEGFSMIYKVGTNHITPWTRIPGSISSGFCANPQFRLKHLDELSDEPKYLTLEDWILFDGTWLSGLSEIEKPFILRVIPQYKGESIKANIKITDFPQDYVLDTDSNEKFTLHCLASLKLGNIKLSWNDTTIEEEVSIISGLEKTLKIDFSDYIKIKMSLDLKSSSCTIIIMNNGIDNTSISVNLSCMGVQLLKSNYKFKLASYKTKEIISKYKIKANNFKRPFFIYAEVNSNYSSAICEVTGKP